MSPPLGPTTRRSMRFFDFGAIHLEPNWQKALAEVRRVLKPGGKFFFEWVTSGALRLTYPFVTEAFGRMEPPDPKLLMQELERQGIIEGFSDQWIGDRKS